MVDTFPFEVHSIRGLWMLFMIYDIFCNNLRGLAKITILFLFIALSILVYIIRLLPEIFYLFFWYNSAFPQHSFVSLHIPDVVSVLKLLLISWYKKFSPNLVLYSELPYLPSSIHFTYCTSVIVLTVNGQSSIQCLTFRHRASSIQDRHFATLQRTLFIYLINKYISLSDICLTVHHWYK